MKEPVEAPRSGRVTVWVVAGVGADIVVLWAAPFESVSCEEVAATKIELSTLRKPWISAVDCVVSATPLPRPTVRGLAIVWLTEPAREETMILPVEAPRSGRVTV